MSDPLAGLDIREYYTAGGRSLTRQMIRGLALAIRKSGDRGLSASGIAAAVDDRHGWPRFLYGSDRRIDRALQLLRKRGAISQGLAPYPRWVWTRGRQEAKP